jgi:SAM-dependent methyltransferase
VDPAECERWAAGRDGNVLSCAMDVADTIEHYERSAREYAKEIDAVPPAFRASALRRLASLLPTGGNVLEVGSGTGRDADYLEGLGVAVRRTDAVRAFAEIQAERGKAVALVDVVADDLGGRYDGALAMCVLMHVPCDRINEVLSKFAAALRPSGAFLVSVREGSGESAGPAGMTFWSRDGFAAHLLAAGFGLEWDDLEVDTDDDHWLTFLARRMS